VSALELKEQLPMNMLKALTLSMTLGLLGTACAASVGDEATHSDSTQDALTVPFAWVAPAAATIIPEQSSTTLVWTGGDPAWNVNLSIVDTAAWTVAASVASNVPNTGTYAWTFPASLGCDRDYQFYVENIVTPKKKYKPKTTMWEYGPVFRLACAPTGPISVPTPAPSGPCATEVVVSNIHYPAQSCAVTTPSFLANMTTMFHFTSKCPTGSQLLGVTSVTCQDAPIPGFSDGSVYTGTACCGPQLSGYYMVKDSYNAIWTVAQVDVFARNRADSECQTKHGSGSIAQDVIVTNVTWNYTLNETYDDRSFNCVLP
jgi:hypothetical protein